jgi:hypothetical protein
MFLLVGAGLCFGQTGNLPDQATQPSTRGGNAQTTTQSDTVKPNDGGKTSSSVRDTTIPASQQTLPSFTAEQGSDNAAGGGELISGTTISASLDLPLSSRSSQIGDRFTASIVQPVKALDGTVLVPPGTKLEGVVTNVDQTQLESSLVPGDAKVEFRFVRMVLPNGATAPVSLTLDSIKAAEDKSKTKLSGDASSSDNTTPDLEPTGAIGASTEATGSAADSPLQGLSVGASLGGGSVMATETNSVALPPQTVLILRLQHNTMVPASGIR